MYVHQVLKRDVILFSKDSFPVNLLRVELIAITENPEINRNNQVVMQ